MQEIEELLQTISALEAQRPTLGDRVVEAALTPLREKLDELTRLNDASKVSRIGKPRQQRKLLSILFVDIVGSTSIIQHMDPEDVSEVFDANLKRLAQPVKVQGGRVTSFTGDGFMAIFGAPTAREDDPERAVRAGLAIIQRAEEMAEKLEKEWNIHDFKVRVGVNTGLVILGGETEGEDTTKGSAVHLAARLQTAAPPGGILVSHDTYRHIRGVFDVETWEPLKVKGFDEPVRVYRILNAKPRAFRSYTRGVEGVETRMVGRQSDLKYLQDAFLSAIEDGEGQVVTIIGEAGVGKSRLLYEFQNWIDLQPPLVRYFEGRANQEAQTTPLAMLRDLFEFRFQIQENDAREAVQEKVEAGFAEVFGKGDAGQMRSHILGQWLGFDFTTSPHLIGVLTDPKRLHDRGLMYLGEYFKGLSDQIPAIFFLEDIHWADDGSLDVLNWLGEHFQHQPLLFACAARHSLIERRPYWGEGLAYHHHLELEPLSKRESYQLVGEILKHVEQVPPEIFELVVEGAEGNPFYVEELVKMLVEDGVVVKGEEYWRVLPERLSEIKVPPTLAGVLQARLESLPQEEQQVLQQASVVGRLFWDSVVAHIQSAEGGRPQSVPEILSSLRGREMVYRREVSAFADAREYLFKHDILREVTYESVLKRLRRRYHGLVADWMIGVTKDSGRAGEFASVIAEHYELAGERNLAADWYTESGTRARNQGAPAQALTFFDRALALLPSDSGLSSDQRDHVRRWQALTGRDEVLGILGETERRMADDVALVALAESIGDDRLIAEAYSRQGYCLGVSGQYPKEREAYLRGLVAAERAGDRKREAMILGLRVFCEVRLGDLEAAADTASAALTCAEEVGDDEVLARILTNVSYLYIETGDLARTALLLDRQLSINRRIGNIEGEVIGLSNLGYTYILLGLYQEAVTALQQCIKMARDIGHRSFLTYGSLNLALAHLRGGDPLLAIAELEQCLPELRAMNDVVDHAICQTYMAMAREQVGQIKEALAGFEQAAAGLTEIGTMGYAHDAKAGITRCLLSLNDLDSAQQQATQLWDYLQQGKIGMEFPILGYETCADIFTAAGQEDLARQIIEAGYKELMTRASKISLPEWRQSFSENVPEHMRIQSRWRNYTQTG